MHTRTSIYAYVYIYTNQHFKSPLPSKHLTFFLDHFAESHTCRMLPPSCRLQRHGKMEELIKRMHPIEEISSDTSLSHFPFMLWHLPFIAQLCKDPGLEKLSSTQNNLFSFWGAVFPLV